MRADVGVLRAQLIGLASAHAHQQRLSWDEVLEEISVVLDNAGVAGEQRIEVLSQAAASYVDPPSSWEWYAHLALDVLVAAGADRQLAGELAATRRWAWTTGSPR